MCSWKYKLEVGYCAGGASYIAKNHRGFSYESSKDKRWSVFAWPSYAIFAGLTVFGRQLARDRLTSPVQQREVHLVRAVANDL